MLLDALRWAKKHLVPNAGYQQIWFGIASGLRILASEDNLRMRLGVYEWPLVRHVRRLSAGARVAYDLGSADGYYVLAFCRLLGPAARVVSFEADERWVAGLHTLLAVNGLSERVVIVQGLVGDRDEGQTLTVDRVVAERGLPAPDLVKLDIEGAEFRALRGMQATLRRSSPALVIEVHSAEVERDCTRYLADLGYRVEVVEGGPFARLLPETRPIGHNRWLVAEQGRSR